MTPEEKKSLTWLPDPENYPAKRLFCLDLLRGIDMFCLAAFGGVLLYAGNLLMGSPAWWNYHIAHHSPYVGFSAWDLVFPLFIFMAGAAIPLSVGRRFAAGEPKLAVWKHVLGRFALLWILGLCVSGGLMSFDPMRIKPYAGALHAIAMGYLVAVIIIQSGRLWVKISATVALALVHAVVFHLHGDYSATGNIGCLVDMKVFSWICPAGSKALDLAYKKLDGSTYVLRSLMFAVSTMCGVFSTEVLMSAKSPWRKAGILAAFGVGLLAVGFGCEPWIPCIKPINSLSFTGQSLGYCVLLLDACYILTDIWKLRRGTGVLLLFGQHALFAYLITQIFGQPARSVAQWFVQGVPRLIGPGHDLWRKLIVSLATMLSVTLFVAVWRRLVLTEKMRQAK